MNRFKKFTALFLALVLAVLTFPVYIYASDDEQYRFNINVTVDGNDRGSIAAFYNNYEDNLFISLKGLAYCLRGTDREFMPVIENKVINISTRHFYDGEASEWTDDERAAKGKASPARHELYVDETERKYHSFFINKSDVLDAFFAPVSLSVMLDIRINVSGSGISINTNEPFVLSADELERSGYLQGVNALVTGDGNTGEIFYSYCGEREFPIASTTKLMTYFVVIDAVSEGKCSLDDIVTVSPKAQRLAESPDGVVPLSAGMQVPLHELLYGMLLPSSNECALALAEHVAGTEAEFVDLMNEKAELLSLKNAHFYNCHGLPDYSAQLLPAKVQNHMSAEEMFVLASALLDEYPQVKDITSVKRYYMETLNKEIKNTNPVLYNMDNAVGLKTGTTNRAGACLVTCIEADKDGQTHNLVTVLLGAEEESGRAVISELASRYAENVLLGLDTEYESVHIDDVEGDAETTVPDDPELVVRRIIKGLK